MSCFNLGVSSSNLSASSNESLLLREESALAMWERVIVAVQEFFSAIRQFFSNFYSQQPPPGSLVQPEVDSVPGREISAERKVSEGGGSQEEELGHNEETPSANPRSPSVGGSPQMFPESSIPAAIDPLPVVAISAEPSKKEGRVEKIVRTSIPFVNDIELGKILIEINRLVGIYAADPTPANEQAVYEKMELIPQMDQDWFIKASLDEQWRRHDLAKKFLLDALSSLSPLSGSALEFIRVSCPSPLQSSLEKEKTKNPLNWNDKTSTSIIYGLTEKIQCSGLASDPNHGIEIYVADSLFNLGQQTDREAQPPRGSLDQQIKQTQGLQAKLAFGRMQTQIINVASNLGYNALLPAIQASGEFGRLKGVVCNGYLIPRTQIECELMVDVVKLYPHLIEYAFIMGFPQASDGSFGSKKVGLFLGAAAALGKVASEDIKQNDLDNLQFECDLLCLRAQLGIAVRLASQEACPVTLNTTAVGLFSLRNNPLCLAYAIKGALRENIGLMRQENVSFIFGLLSEDLWSSVSADLQSRDLLLPAITRTANLSYNVSLVK